MNMKRLTAKTLAALAAALMTLGFFPQQARAAEPIKCTGTLADQWINNPVVVPAGASCTITGSTVTGDVQVERNGTLRLNYSIVKGNVLSDAGHAFVQVWGSDVTGRGNFTNGGQVVLIDSAFGNTVNVNRNSGLQRIFNNTITQGDLYCWGNTALTGGGNTAARNLAVQCAAPKRHTQISPTTAAPKLNSNGTVTITGYLRGYATDGKLKPMAGKPVVVETRPAGTTKWNWTARTAPTDSNGRFSITLNNKPGQETRLVYTSTESNVTHAYRTIGRMPAGGSLDSRCYTGARVMCASKSERKLYYLENGVLLKTVDARFGRPGYDTREGSFEVFWKSRHHVSSLYGSAMPWAMFFSGGQAVHYSADFAQRGWVGGSAGCINIRDAATLDWIYQRVRTGDKIVVYK